jgi:hypothetical protein
MDSAGTEKMHVRACQADSAKKKGTAFFICGRVALRLCLPGKQEVPRPYSGAEDGAPSLTGTRDDDLFDDHGLFDKEALLARNGLNKRKN